MAIKVIGTTVIDDSRNATFPTVNADSIVSGTFDTDVGTPISIGGSGTIGGTTWENGSFKVGTDTTGWSMDTNELYNSNNGIIGSLTGSISLTPSTYTRSTRPLYLGTALGDGYELSVKSAGSDTVVFDLASATADTILTISSEDGSIDAGSKFVSFSDAATERFHVNGLGDMYVAGDVGIGNTAPTEKLHVEGTVRSNGVDSHGSVNVFKGSTASLSLIRPAPVGVNPPGYLGITFWDTLGDEAVLPDVPGDTKARWLNYVMNQAGVDSDLRWQSRDANGDVIGTVLTMENDTRYIVAETKFLSPIFETDTGTPISIGGSSSIAGTTWDNGSFKVGSIAEGWSMDTNELYNSVSSAIGTLSGDLNLKPAGYTRSSSPMHLGPSLMTGRELTVTSTGSNTVAFDLTSASGDTILDLSSSDGTISGGSKFINMAANSTTDVMYVTGLGDMYVAGDVGIGTESPELPLHVVGQARVDGLEVHGATAYALRLFRPDTTSHLGISFNDPAGIRWSNYVINTADAKLNWRAYDATGVAIGNALQIDNTTRVVEAIVSMESPLFETSTGTPISIGGGSGTIGGTTWNNGVFKVGTDTTGWSMDTNELYNSDDGIIGSLTGSITLTPATYTRSTRPLHLGSSITAGVELSASAAGSNVATFDLTSAAGGGDTILNLTSSDATIVAGSKFVEASSGGAERFSVAGDGDMYVAGDVGIGVQPTAGTKLNVFSNGLGSEIQTWTADLGNQTRTAKLLAPEADTTSSPFVLMTNNAWIMRIDANNALELPATGTDILSHGNRILTEVDTGYTHAVDVTLESGTIYSANDATIEAMSIDVDQLIVRRLPTTASAGQVAPVGEYTTWRREPGATTYPYFTTDSGTVKWVNTGLGKDEILTTFSSGLNAAFTNPVLTGVASGSAIQQTNTDSTADLILVNGSHGLGIPIELTTTSHIADRTIGPGFFSYDPSVVTGGPVTTAGNHNLIVTKESASVSRSYISIESGQNLDYKMWVGNRDNSSSINWKEVILGEDYGIGINKGVLVANTGPGLDALNASGLYYGLGGGHAGVPLGDNPFPAFGGAFNLLSLSAGTGNDDDYLSQVAFRCSGTGTQGQMATRSQALVADGWGPWRQVYDQQNIVGDVSVDGSDVPTGSIIKRGYDDTTGFSYTQYADGTMEVWGIKTMGNIGDQYGSGLGTWDDPYMTDLLHVTWPIAFAFLPTVTATPMPTIAGTTNVKDRGLTVAAWRPPTLIEWKNIRAVAIGSTDAVFAVEIHIHAHGRWF